MTRLFLVLISVVALVGCSHMSRHRGLPFPAAVALGLDEMPEVFTEIACVKNEWRIKGGERIGADKSLEKYIVEHGVKAIVFDDWEKRSEDTPARSLLKKLCIKHDVNYFREIPMSRDGPRRFIWVVCASEQADDQE